MSQLTPPSLGALLEAERECCARLHTVLDAERAAAAAYDYAALLACLREREAVHAEWTRAAGARRTALREDGRSLATIAATEPALAATIKRLRAEASALAREQRVNARLVAAALEQVTGLLNVIRREDPETRYDGSAKLTPGVRSAGGWSA